MTEGTVSLEPGLRGSFSKFMVTMTVILTTFYRSAVSPDCSASPPPQGQLSENCGGLTVYRLHSTHSEIHAQLELSVTLSIQSWHRSINMVGCRFSSFTEVLRSRCRLLVDDVSVRCFIGLNSDWVKNLFQLDDKI